jgi:hypothetical protein
VVKIQARRDKAARGEVEKLKDQVAAAKRRERERRAQEKRKIAAAKAEARRTERSKTAIRDKRMAARIKKLEDEKKMLIKGTSPQEVGLCDEVILVRRLQQEFPDDKIEHAGKGGDVLHYVKFEGEITGCIVYECKHTPRISTDHVQQTALAKKTRNANYGILVTTGARKGFSGLAKDSGILVVAQTAVLTLARICRDSLVAMAKQKLSMEAKQEAATRLMDYVTSPVCSTPLEDAISQTERARGNLIKEMKQHFGDWKKRHEIYETINYDISHVQSNIERVLGGDEPLKLEKPERKPLALPAATGN